jgi:hypothetical protein
MGGVFYKTRKTRQDQFKVWARFSYEHRILRELSYDSVKA